MDTVVKDGLEGSSDDAESDGWLRTGGGPESKVSVGSVHTLDASGNLGEREEEDEEIPDMEDEDDDEEAIIRDAKQSGTKAYVRTMTPMSCSHDSYTKAFLDRYEHTRSTSPTRHTTVLPAYTSLGMHLPQNLYRPKT